MGVDPSRNYCVPFGMVDINITKMVIRLYNTVNYLIYGGKGIKYIMLNYKTEDD